MEAWELKQRKEELERKRKYLAELDAVERPSALAKHGREWLRARIKLETKRLEAYEKQIKR